MPSEALQCHHRDHPMPSPRPSEAIRGPLQASAANQSPSMLKPSAFRAPPLRPTNLGPPATWGHPPPGLHPPPGPTRARLGLASRRPLHASAHHGAHLGLARRLGDAEELSLLKVGRGRVRDHADRDERDADQLEVRARLGVAQSEEHAAGDEAGGRQVLEGRVAPPLRAREALVRGCVCRAWVCVCRAWVCVCRAWVCV